MIAWYNKKHKSFSYSNKDKKFNKRIRMENKKLCKKYPWLIPRNRWSDEICWVRHSYDSIELDDMPKGWRKAFGDIWCEQVHDLLKKYNCIKDFRIQQLKEKFGQFRQYFNFSFKELNDLITDYEIISEYVCVRCGKLNSPVINNQGWYEPICKECYDKQRFNNVSYKKKIIDAGIESLEDMKIPTNYTVTCYSVSQGTYDMQRDISDIVQKIQYKARRRKDNSYAFFE